MWNDLSDKNTNSTGAKTFEGCADVLSIKDGEMVHVRFLADPTDTVPNPKMIWMHTWKPDAKRFYRFACTGQNNGCKYCEQNKTGKYLNVKDNRLRPYPYRAEYVGAAYVYEKQEVKLVIGKAIWTEEINGYGKKYATLIDRDYEIERLGSGQRTTYKVRPGDPIPFGVNLQGKRIPTEQDYIAWLMTQIAQVPLGYEVVVPVDGTMAGMPSDGSGPGPGVMTFGGGMLQNPTLQASPTPATYIVNNMPAVPHPYAPPVATPGAPIVAATGAVPVVSGAGTSDALIKDVLMKKFSGYWSQKFDGVLLAKALGAKQYENLTSTELVTVMNEYKALVKQAFNIDLKD